MAATLTSTDAVQFVLDEGRLLNESRYTEWLSLFAPDGMYWVPLEGDRQADPQSSTSLAYEDRLLLQTRVQRLQGPRAHSLEPGVRSLHVLQTPRIEAASDTQISLFTPFLYTEVCGDRQTVMAGTWRHRLRPSAAGLHIVLKRVDLLQAGSALEAIQLFP